MNIVWHENPDKTLIEICKNLDSIRKTEGQTTYWALVKKLLLTDPWFLFRVALEWAWLDDNLVGNKFIRHIADNWGEDVGVLFPRGHGKTLPMSGMCIFSILNDPNIAILQISRTDGNADKIGAFVASTLLENDYLQQCFSKKHNPKDGFLPTTASECREWGKDGYRLPWAKKRLDPTFLSISLRGAKAGKHPDIIWIDDPTEKENNDERGWNDVREVIQGLWFLVPAHGWMWWTGTRWHDADPIGMAERGRLTGKQGPFKFIKESCYIDDLPEKGPTYPEKVRWNMPTVSGYTVEALDAKRLPEQQGGLGQFFDAQMRNDPSPSERAQIHIEDVVIYADEQLPQVGPVLFFGMEITGGGMPIFTGFQEHCEKLRLKIPVVEISNPRKVGLEKSDKIVATLQPLIESGRLYAKEWMIGDKHASEGLGYEIRRVGKALHDDIIDALHNIPLHLSRGATPPRETSPMDVYISVDLAWTEKKRSDWTVAIAVGVDHKGNHWILDYDRFQISSPTGIYTRLLEFYKRFEEYTPLRQLSTSKFPGMWKP